MVSCRHACTRNSYGKTFIADNSNEVWKKNKQKIFKIHEVRECWSLWRATFSQISPIANDDQFLNKSYIKYYAWILGGFCWFRRDRLHFQVFRQNKLSPARSSASFTYTQLLVRSKSYWSNSGFSLENTVESTRWMRGKASEVLHNHGFDDNFDTKSKISNMTCFSPKTLYTWNMRESEQSTNYFVGNLEN